MSPVSKTLFVAAAFFAALPQASHAEDASPLTFNIGAVTDYRYRGISQTRLKPAVQGGLDYAFAGGFYLGAWASTIKWIKDGGGDAGIEIDLYGGYKGEITKELTYDVGVLSYVYPSNKLSPSANTTEVYGAVTYGPVTAKYSHAITDTFANPDSKSSYYLDLSATFDLGGVTVVPHVGHQRIDGPNSGTASYRDYSLTVSKDFDGIVPSLAIVGNSKVYRPYYTSGPGNKYLAKSTVVLGVKYNF